MNPEANSWKSWLIEAFAISLISFCWTSLSMAQAKSYFLSSSGNDKSEGLRNHPWKTISRLNRARLHSGDAVYFEGGKLFTGTIFLDSAKSGNSSGPLLISSYGKGSATIQSGDSSAINIFQSQFLSIRNLHLVGAGRKTGNLKPGLAIVNAHDIAIDSLDIQGFQKAGLLVYSSSDIRILNVYAHENGAAGIEVGGINGKRGCHNLYIAHCRAENNPGDPSNLTNHSGNGIVVGECSKATIEYCTATNNGWDMPRIGNGPVGIWAYEADHVTIQHCLSYRNKTSRGGADGGGFDLDGGVTNSCIQYCLSYENQGAGYCIFQYYYASPWHDNVFRYNISENDGSVSDAGAGMYVWNSSRDENLFYNCLVYNNSIYNAKVAALSFSELSKRKNFSFYNNIFVGRDSLIKGEKGVDIFGHNLWWTLTKGGNEMLAEKINGLTLDPEFKRPGQTLLTASSGLALFDQYRIAANSPLLKMGLDLKDSLNIDIGKFDFNGRPPIPKGIGACF
jgi:hypothetical protein